MPTYGKQKRHLLPALPGFGAPMASRSTKDREKNKKHETVREPPSNLDTRKDSLKFQAGVFHHDSVDEMANALLEDTTDEILQPRKGGGLSHFSKVNYKTEPNLAKYLHPKSQPSLPEFPFSGDGTLALGMASDGTAISNVSLTYFSGTTAETGTTSPSAPAIPRKSSKRKSTQPKSTNSKLLLGDEDEIDPNIESALQSAKNPLHVQSSEMALASAFAPLKRESRKILSNGTDKVLLQGPYLPPKGSFKDNKVFKKIQMAMKKIQPQRTWSRRSSTPDERLLDPSISELQEWKGEEPRSSEGNDLAKPKAYHPTDHGIVKRKPVHDDAKSSKLANSKQSDELSSIQGHRSSVLAQIPTGYEDRLQDGMGLNLIGKSAAEPYKPLDPKLDEPQPPRSEDHTDIDSIFSEDPEAASTPRLRPMSSFHMEESRGFQSSEIILDDNHVGVAAPVEETLKRKDAQTMLSPKIKRTKKHPSPPRDALAQLALDAELMFGSVGAGAINSTAVSALSGRDANKVVKSARQTTASRAAFTMCQPAKSTVLARPVAVKPPKSVPRSALTKGELHEVNNQNTIPEGSMDIDELQWDDTMYNISSKKV